MAELQAQLANAQGLDEMVADLQQRLAESQESEGAGEDVEALRGELEAMTEQAMAAMTLATEREETLRALEAEREALKEQLAAGSAAQPEIDTQEMESEIEVLRAHLQVTQDELNEARLQLASAGRIEGIEHIEARPLSMGAGEADVSDSGIEIAGAVDDLEPLLEALTASSHARASQVAEDVAHWENINTTVGKRVSDLLRIASRYPELQSGDNNIYVVLDELKQALEGGTTLIQNGKVFMDEHQADVDALEKALKS